MAMDVVVPHEALATEYDCKRPSCPRPARSCRGRNAYLCDFHVNERNERNAAEAALGVVPVPVTAAGALVPGTLVAACEALVAPAAALEAALATHRGARFEAQAIGREFAEALRRVREITQHLAAA